MPASAYAPDPTQWINVSAAAIAARAAQAASAKKESTQRPLVAIKHSGYPTPPTSNPRHQRSSSNSTTNENLPRSSAGPSRLKESQNLKQAGFGSYFATPPTTASEYRRRVDRLKGKEAESSKGRGSPVSRSAGLNSGKVERRPLGSRLAKTELIDCWGSDTEEDEIEVDDDRPTAGSSKRRQSVKKKDNPKHALVLPDVSRLLNRVFSSGELSDLPPGYGDESDTDDAETIPLSPTPPIIPPPTHQNNFPASLPQPRLNPHLDPTQRPQAFDDDSQPNLTPLIMTQPPRDVLKKFWRLNGMSTEDIAKGAEPWGKSAGYLENERRIKDRSERPKQDTMRQLPSSLARKTAARISKIMVYQEEDDERHDSDDEMVEISKPGKAGREIISEKRAPLSPMTLNKAKGVRRKSPGSPSPRKSAKKRKLKHGSENYPNQVPAKSDDIVKVIEHGAFPLITNNPQKLSLSPNPLTIERDHRSVTPEPQILQSHRQRHHTITPPKQRDSPHRNAEISFTPPPSPIPFDFPLPLGEEVVKPKEFKPVEVDETLMTWSQARAETMARDMDIQENIMEEGEEIAKEAGEETEDPIQVDTKEEEESPKEDEVVSKKVTEETQSIPATEFGDTQSYPLLFASQIAVKRGKPFQPTASPQVSSESPIIPTPQPSQVAGPSRPRLSQNWAAVQNSGLLQAIVPAPLPPPKAPKAGTKRKVKGKGKEEGQSSLEAFGIMKQRKPKRASGFEEDFEDEVDIEEEERDAGPSRERDGFRKVPHAPYHPALRPAGIKAMKDREVAASTPKARTRAHTRSAKGSSPAVPLSTPRAGVERSSKQQLDIFGDASGSSPPSSSLLTDTTADQTPPYLRKWADDLAQRES